MVAVARVPTPFSALSAPLMTTSPPKTEDPVKSDLQSMAPLTKKNTSFPISEGASGEDFPPTKAVEPVVKIDPAVVLVKKSETPPPLAPPPVDDMVTWPLDAEVIVTLSPATK